jgi:hypothetical protein
LDVNCLSCFCFTFELCFSEKIKIEWWLKSIKASTHILKSIRGRNLFHIMIKESPFFRWEVEIFILIIKVFFPFMLSNDFPSSFRLTFILFYFLRDDLESLNSGHNCEMEKKNTYNLWRWFQSNNMQWQRCDKLLHASTPLVICWQPK